MVRKNSNKDPKKGDLVLGGEQTSPVHTQGVHFLFPVQGQGPEQHSRRDYLGEREKLNLAMLHTFMDLRDWCRPSGNFYGASCLPREAQKIDQMMEAFAQQYCWCNLGVFESTHVCYVLSFAQDNAEHQPSQSQHLGTSQAQSIL